METKDQFCQQIVQNLFKFILNCPKGLNIPLLGIMIR